MLHLINSGNSLNYAFASVHFTKITTTKRNDNTEAENHTHILLVKAYNDKLIYILKEMYADTKWHRSTYVP